MTKAERKIARQALIQKINNDAEALIKHVTAFRNILITAAWDAYPDDIKKTKPANTLKNVNLNGMPITEEERHDLHAALDAQIARQKTGTKP